MPASNPEYGVLAIAGVPILKSFIAGGYQVKKSIGLLSFVVLITLVAAAQSEFPKAELAGGYSYVNLNPQIATSQNHWERSAPST